MKNTKKSYFENLDTKKITDNRNFWRTVLPLFTQNSSKGEKINLIDDSKTISSDEVKKLTSLMIVKPYLVMRSSMKHLINFPLMWYLPCMLHNFEKNRRPTIFFLNFFFLTMDTLTLFNSKKQCLVRRILRLRILIMILSTFCVQKISCYEDKS